MEVESARCFNRLVAWLDPPREHLVRTVPSALLGEGCLSRRLSEKGEANVSKKRGVFAWCLFGLATILMFVSSLTVWSKRQLLDDQAWGLLDAAAGKRRSARRDRAEAQRRAVPASRC